MNSSFVIFAKNFVPFAVSFFTAENAKIMKKKVVTNPNNKKSLSLQFKIEVMMPPSKTKKKKFLQPEQNKMEEPLAEYFKSDQYTESVKTITFSSHEEQEEGNYKYWRSLTPEQRLELHYLLLIHVYSDEIEKNKNIPYNKITFSS